MRIVLAAIVAALVLVPPAMANVVEAGGVSTAAGLHWSWDASYDTATNTLLFTCDLTNADTGAPANTTGTTIASVTITQANNQKRTLDCVPLMNLGQQTINVNLKVDTVGRWSGFYVQDQFRP